MLYPETGSEFLQGSVNDNHFRLAKERAISQRGNFAFETNFSADDPTVSLSEFQNAGYNCHLIFMGMPTIAECVQRVSFRVKAGGHKVSEESIEYNFTYGYKNLYKYFRLFDSVTLLDSAIPEDDKLKVPEPILIWKKGKYKLLKTTYPGWIEKLTSEIEGQA